MESEQRTQFDEEVEERVRLACRLLKVVRHDLGNFVYPSRELERSVGAGSAEGARYVRQTRMLVSMVEEIRGGMSVVRWEPYPDEPALTQLGDWWRRFHPYANASLGGDGRCEFVADGSVMLAAPATRLSLLTLALLAGLDAQAGRDDPKVTLGASVDGAMAALEFEAALENGSAGSAATPALARRIVEGAGGEIETRADGARLSSVVRLPMAARAGSGASVVEER